MIEMIEEQEKYFRIYGRPKDAMRDVKPIGISKTLKEIAERKRMARLRTQSKRAVRTIAAQKAG
jgi:hypothetical protein